MRKGLKLLLPIMFLFVLVGVLVPNPAYASPTAYYPSGYNLLAGTTRVTGTVADLTANDQVYMQFRSAVSAYGDYNQVTYVGAGAGDDTTGTPLSVPYPSPLQANDLLLLQIIIKDTTYAPTTPSGFLPRYSADSTGTGRQWIFYRFATGSETGSLSVTVGGGNLKVGRMYQFRNVALTSWYESASFGTGTDASIEANSVTTTVVKCLAVSFVFEEDNNAIDSFTGETGGDWTEAAEYLTSTSTDAGIQLQTATMASAGTISGGSYTMSAADPWGVRSFALKPSAAPSEYTSEVEFTGTSTPASSGYLVLTVDSQWTAASVAVTIQLYDYTAVAYPTTGDGFLTYTSSATAGTDETKTLATGFITDFQDSSGNWKVKIKGVKSTSTQFDFKADFVQYDVTVPSTASVYVDVDSTSVDVSTDFNATIKITGVTDLYGWEFQLSYNTTVLTATQVYLGPLLNDTVGTANTWGSIIQLNDTAGLVWATQTIIGDLQGPTGSGTLANVTFSPDIPGTSLLDLHDTQLTGYSVTYKVAYVISNTETDVTITVTGVIPEFPLGVALEIALIPTLIFVMWRKRKSRISSSRNNVHI